MDDEITLAMRKFHQDQRERALQQLGDKMERGEEVSTIEMKNLSTLHEQTRLMMDGKITSLPIYVPFK